MAKIVILSGAGISAESGISTFRGSGGLWEKYKIEEICSAGCLEYNRDKTIEFYDRRREELQNIKPNHAHKMIATLTHKYPKLIANVTQNVDNLFEKAGCKDTIHLHGFLQNLRCSKCKHTEVIGYAKQNKDKTCPKCNSLLRPDIVFFGESVPKYIELYNSFDDCEFFIVIGTSGNVINTDFFINYKMKKTILNILEPSLAINDKLYSKVLYKPATEAINEIVEEIEKYLISIK
jgi:NAD-dependent deacetylase